MLRRDLLFPINVQDIYFKQNALCHSTIIYFELCTEVVKNSRQTINI